MTHAEAVDGEHVLLELKLDLGLVRHHERTLGALQKETRGGIHVFRAQSCHTHASTNSIKAIITLGITLCTCETKPRFRRIGKAPDHWHANARLSVEHNDAINATIAITLNFAF